MIFEELLHSTVATAALKHFHDGHYRDAILNGIIATFDLLRNRTGLDLDGTDLVNHAFSVQRPYLLVADLQQLIEDADHGDILRFDGVYVRSNDDLGGGTFLRFFQSGQVLAVSISGELDVDWVPDWLTLDWADWQKRPAPSYQLSGTRVSFTQPVSEGEVRYEGHVRGPALRLRVHSTATNHRSEDEYRFRPLPRGAA